MVNSVHHVLEFGHDLKGTWEPWKVLRDRQEKVKVKSLSRVPLFATPWTVAYEALPSMGFSRQEHWSGCYFLLQGIFLRSNLGLLHCKQMFLPSEPPGKLSRQERCSSM